MKFHPCSLEHEQLLPGYFLFLLSIHKADFEMLSFDNFIIEPEHDKTTKRRLRSAWASAKSEQSLRCALYGYIMTQTFFRRTGKGLMPRLI